MLAGFVIALLARIHTMRVVDEAGEDGQTTAEYALVILAAAAVAVVLIAIHVVSASVVEPTITGKAVGLSPLVVFFAVAFWGGLWGILGMILAVPLTASLKIVLDHVPSARYISAFLEHKSPNMPAPAVANHPASIAVESPTPTLTSSSRAQRRM